MDILAVEPACQDSREIDDVLFGRLAGLAALINAPPLLDVDDPDLMQEAQLAEHR
ncbi:hypothetical protein [Corynebacterium lowii]|uniref:Uncharacterized protein n=1 Tax=Corynebacterium lowii TaxID=1544413 RepID=A0A0Q0ZC22_9CORY|nr:hypothetical protein [Corynebacterium lowii]KQB87584.1 hypothetical protein Clow_00644 [Corynebacterium lowii]MDP9851821.1 hypothetical protein [Corynebacterium lowii]